MRLTRTTVKCDSGAAPALNQRADPCRKHAKDSAEHGLGQWCGGRHLPSRPRPAGSLSEALAGDEQQVVVASLVTNLSGQNN